MTLDKELHRQLLLEVIKTSNFPGHVVELVVEVKRAIIDATVTESIDIDVK